MAKTEELLKRLVRFHGAEPDMEAVKEYARVIDGYLTDGAKTQERLLEELEYSRQRLNRIAADILQHCDYKMGSVTRRNGKITETDVSIDKYFITAREYDDPLEEDDKIFIEVEMKDIKLRQDIVDRSNFEDNNRNIEYHKHELDKLLAEQQEIEKRLGK